MIIGNGMLAKAFKAYADDRNIVIFASGVSNSKEIQQENYKREYNLLFKTIKNNKNATLVYFSTCSIEDMSQKNSEYVTHKIKLEKLIQEKCLLYYIFRLPQVVGETNSPTLVNFLINAIKKGEHFKVQKNATRNLIDVDDVFKIVNVIIKKHLFSNKIINVASPYNISVLKIVNNIEEIISIKAKYDLVEYGQKQYINTTEINSLNLNIFNNQYIKNILTKRIQNV